MEGTKSMDGVVIRTEAFGEAAAWFCKYLFFQERDTGKEGERCVENGDCVLYLIEGSAEERALLPDECAWGLDHVALGTEDITKAMEYLKGQGLRLDVEDEPFYNPGVFGDGEYYFHVVTPFGMAVEISQRAGGSRREEGRGLILGLDHIGISCGDFDRETAFFGKQGFEMLFEPVNNYNEKEGRIRCVMMGDGTLTLEIYQFLDQKGAAREGFLESIRGGRSFGVSPSNVRVSGTRKKEER